jgi:hypothetical protein
MIGVFSEKIMLLWRFEVEKIFLQTAVLGCMFIYVK